MRPREMRVIPATSHAMLILSLEIAGLRDMEVWAASDGTLIVGADGWVRDEYALQVFAALATLWS